MGNCQAVEAATVIIQHPGPGSRVERIYWSISAHEVMVLNPGHYVALLLTSPVAMNGGNGSASAKHLKLLRPDDSLLPGQVYRLVSFEDVLKQFSAKKSIKLGKMLDMESRLGRGNAITKKNDNSRDCPNARSKPRFSNCASTVQAEPEVFRLGGGCSMARSGRHSGSGQWRPALHSISEIGT